MIQPKARIRAIRPRSIPRTGDDRPASGLYAFVLRMSGWHQAAAIGLSLAVAGLSVVPLELQRRIVDDAIAEDDARLLALLAGLYLGAVLASAALKFLLRVYQGWMSESAVRYCRRHLARLRDEAGMGAAERREDGGTAVSVLNAEIEAVGGFVGMGLSDPARHVGIMVAILGYMAVVEPLIAAVSLGFLAPQVALAPALQRKLNALIAKRIRLLRRMSEKVAERRDGHLNDRRFRLDTDAIYLNRIRIYLWKFAGKAAMNLLNHLAPLSVLAVGGWLVIQGESQIGVVVAFLTGFQRLAEPMRETIAYYRLAAQTAVKHDLIARWMRDPAN